MFFRNAFDRKRDHRLFFFNFLLHFSDNKKAFSIVLQDTTSTTENMNRSHIIDEMRAFFAEQQPKCEPRLVLVERHTETDHEAKLRRYITDRQKKMQETKGSEKSFPFWSLEPV